jgi:hypothetical protein
MKRLLLLLQLSARQRDAQAALGAFQGRLQAARRPGSAWFGCDSSASSRAPS